MKKIMWTKSLVKQFIADYEKMSKEELAERYECSVATVENSARALRKAGFPLPTKRESHSLSSVIAELLGDKGYQKPTEAFYDFAKPTKKDQ